MPVGEDVSDPQGEPGEDDQDQSETPRHGGSILGITVRPLCAPAACGSGFVVLEAEVGRGEQGPEGDALGAEQASTVPPRSTTATTSTTSAPASCTAWAASSSDVPRVTVSSVTTTLSPGVERAGDAAAAAVVLGLLAHAEGLERRGPGSRPPPAVTKATGSAPMVSPPMAVASAGTTDEHGVGHEQHRLGPAHRLLGVDEPAALACPT